MTEQEFKTQIFKTFEQWESGLLYRLELLKGGGITLYPVPTFESWIQEVDGIKNPSCLAVDECGQIYFIDAETCKLYRYNPATHILEHILCISDCGSEPGTVNKPARIIIDKFTLWILDAGNQRVQAYSRDNYQIKYIIDKFMKDDTDEYLEEPVDIGLDEQGNLYILDRKLRQIFKYDNNAHYIQGFGKEDLREPVGIASGKDNKLYVIDKDSERKGFLVFTEKGEFTGLIGNFPEDFQPSAIAIDRKGNIFIIDQKTGLIHQFDPDGSHIGIIPAPDFKGQVYSLAVDSRGNLYASTDKGIALLSARQAYTRENGIYYSKTLDSGIKECQWHRLALQADIPDKTVLEVYFYASDDSALKHAIDDILLSSQSTQEKADQIDKKIQWIGPEKPPKDMLFRGKSGRYLWLKLVLSTFEEKVRPVVKHMKVFYPRISYLRYLPAIYQEDPVSREFLERFLSIFETVFYDLETEISHIFKYFDPDTTPQNFLSWLASWLNIALEEDWPEEKKRHIIRAAYSLYKRRGTLSGIIKLIEIYTGKAAIILEHSRAGKPMLLGKEFRLGVNTMLVQTPVRGFRLGDDSILGRVALRDVVQLPEDPFLQTAHRFTVILDLTLQELSLYEKGLRRILNEEKPAHTAYTLIAAHDKGMGMGTYIGINSRVGDYRPVRIGVDSVPGTGLIAFDSGEKSGKVERHSKVEVDTLLI
jgi:phage tail-like protein